MIIDEEKKYVKPYSRALAFFEIYLHAQKYLLIKKANVYLTVSNDLFYCSCSSIFFFLLLKIT